MRGFMVLALALVASFPAFGRDTEIVNATGSLFSQNYTPEVPASLNIYPRMKMAIEVDCSGVDLDGVSSEKFVSTLKAEVISQAFDLCLLHGIDVIKGSPRKGMWVFHVTATAVSGKDLNRNNSSLSQSEAWRRGTRETSVSNENGLEWNKVYLVLKPEIHEFGGDETIIASTRVIIAKSITQLTASDEGFDSFRSDSYSSRRGYSNSSRAESSHSEYRNSEEVSRDSMIQSLVRDLSAKAVAYTLISLNKSEEMRRYGQIKAREAMAPPKPKPIPPVRPANGGLVIEVTQ